MGVDRDWAEMHGYKHITCRSCGFSGYSDSECGSDEGETCEDCGCSHRECSCREGFAHEGTCRSRTHVARRDHGTGKYIKKGDTYRVTRTHYWREGGPSWWRTIKTLIKKAADSTAVA